MWYQVKSSAKTCSLCSTSENTVVLKNRDEEFQGVVCMKHFAQILMKWDANGSADAKGSSKQAQAE